MSAYVEFDLRKFEDNLKGLKAKIPNVKFIFPVKCCNNEKVLELVSKYEYGFDISNINEYNIIKKYLNGHFLSCSSPMSYELESINYKNIKIVANNLSSYLKGKGLRINLNGNEKFDKSRFGEDYTLLSSSIKEELTYIHLHNSDHKDSKKCNDILDEVKKIISSFPNLKCIDIGGHLEDLSFKSGIEYLQEMRSIIPTHIDIIVEAGDFLFKDCGKLFCEVIDVRDNKMSQTVTLNFSKMANQRWAYPIYYEEEQKELVDTVFYGCSCCETDIYLETKARRLKKGDKLMFQNISPYSYQWDTEFNGINKIRYDFKN